MKLPRIAGNLLHLEGRPGLMPRYSPGMGVRGFQLTSALIPEALKGSLCDFDFTLSKFYMAPSIEARSVF